MVPPTCVAVYIASAIGSRSERRNLWCTLITRLLSTMDLLESTDRASPFPLGMGTALPALAWSGSRPWRENFSTSGWMTLEWDDPR